MSIKEGKHLEALQKLDGISKPMPSSLAALYVATYSFVMESYGDSLSERNVSDAFFSNLDKHLPGAKRITNIKSLRDHIPDGFVEINDETMPVEVKAGDFNTKALLQLKRYIKEYGCRRGIAVARRLKCALPSNITFVCMGK